MKRTAKRIVYTLVLIMVAFSMIAATTTATKVVRITAGKSVTANLGRAGVSFTKSFFAGDLRLSRKDTSILPGITQPVFTQKLFDARFTDSKGNKVTYVIGSVYVYFRLAGKERALWNKGMLTIMYFDPWKNDWTECSTYQVSSAAASPIVACRMKNFGLYGLAVR